MNEEIPLFLPLPAPGETPLEYLKSVRDFMKESYTLPSLRSNRETDLWEAAKISFLENLVSVIEEETNAE